MLLIDKSLASAVKTGQMSKQEMINEILRQNSVYEIASQLVDYLLEYGEQRPIVVDQAEYDRIVSLFKIRGLRADGSPEKRGRKG